MFKLFFLICLTIFIENSYQQEVIALNEFVQGSVAPNETIQYNLNLLRNDELLVIELISNSSTAQVVNLQFNFNETNGFFQVSAQNSNSFILVCVGAYEIGEQNITVFTDGPEMLSYSFRITSQRFFFDENNQQNQIFRVVNGGDFPLSLVPVFAFTVNDMNDVVQFNFTTLMASNVTFAVTYGMNLMDSLDAFPSNYCQPTEDNVFLFMNSMGSLEFTADPLSPSPFVLGLNYLSIRLTQSMDDIEFRVDVCYNENCGIQNTITETSTEPSSSSTFVSSSTSISSSNIIVNSASKHGLFTILYGMFLIYMCFC